MSKADMHLRRSLKRKTMQKLMAFVELKQLIGVADQFRKQQLIDRWHLYVHFSKRRNLGIQRQAEEIIYKKGLKVKSIVV